MRGSFLTDGETECFRSDVALHCFGRDFTIRFNLIFGFLDVLKSHLADFPVNFSFSYISRSLIFPNQSTLQLLNYAVRFFSDP